MGLNVLRAAQKRFSQSGIKYEYKYGGNGTDSNGNGIPETDCSYLVAWALQDAGYNITPNTMGGTHGLFEGDNILPATYNNFDVFDKNTAIKSGTLQPGDLILFQANSGGGQHIGIVTGYDANGNIKFYGSQTSTGPAETTVDNFNKYGGFHVIGALRPKDTDSFYDPSKDSTRNVKDIEITISDTTANEKEGTITFTININQPLDKDFTFNVSTIDGSATGNVDYMTIPNAPVTIKAGSKQTTYSIPIANDGIYEINEEFMLYAHYEKGTYTGYDLGKVTGGTGVGTIIDNPVGGCPVVVQPDFGLNFTVPTPIVSATYGGSGGGGISYYGGGGGGGSYYTPSVYTGSTYTPPVVLPHVPVYECHYDLKLFSVALVSLPVACQPSTPPLVFDLNKDGITSLSMAASLALFDYNADNVKEHTAWIQNGDALLVRDTNNDGLITNGSELFGDHTLKRDGTTATDGYDALRDYDTNQDGIIDANDEHFNELKLWRDNGDGITEQGELKTLTEEGIASITLPNTTPTPILENGNTITNTSTYTQSDGSIGTLKDVWFAYENIATETYFDTDGDGFSEKMDSWMNANLFTCKTFTIQKVLHVKINIQQKGANNGDEIKVA